MPDFQTAGVRILKYTWDSLTIKMIRDVSYFRKGGPSHDDVSNSRDVTEF